MKVAMIDFDGTITLKNDFPNIGELRPGALEGIKATFSGSPYNFKSYLG